ncbi:MAG: WD40 repeat domain-containing protein [Candidatus Endonucleobacter bathymodioli]|uniref:WD40 repeat domain-containing protein n=1 Tax=Candidatus Endonucleibacter bathymodioli TaxID=539814 RepID=A0AA90SDZ9_9GAMM|nr:WD40 repeat domain-containing protein [Candidatus Endonucleobacter bathymodioli]
MKMIRLFIVTLAIVLSGASMPSLGGLSKKMQEQKTDYGEVWECSLQANLHCCGENSDELAATQVGNGMLDKGNLEYSKLFENLSLEKKSIVYSPEVASSQRSRLDSLSGSLSEREDEFYDAHADTESLENDGLAITSEFKREYALKNSTMATNNGGECNVVRNQEALAKLPIYPLYSSYTVDSSLMVDHETSKASESLVPKRFESDDYPCTGKNSILSLSTNNRYMLTKDDDCVLTIWVNANEGTTWRKDRIIFKDAGISSACFSPDSRYMVVHTFINVTIYRLRNGNTWEEQGSINCHMRATFSPDSRHLVVYNNEWIKILSLGRDRVIESVCGSLHKDVISAYFTPKSSSLIVVCYKQRNTDFSLDGDGRWERQANIPTNGKDEHLIISSWNNDHYMVTNRPDGKTEKVAILCKGVDSKWIEKATFTASMIYAIGTSIDGIHIIVITDESDTRKVNAKIWSLGADGVLKGKDILNDKKDIDHEKCIGAPDSLSRKICQAKFNDDGRHVVILSYGMIILCSQNEDGDWIEKFIIGEEKSTESFTFSIDNTDMIIISLMDCNWKNTFIVWNLGMNEEWLEENIFSSNHDRVDSTAFSDGGSNMVTICANGKVKIWSEKEVGEQWSKKISDWFQSSI